MEQSQLRNFDFEAITRMNEAELRGQAEADLRAVYFGLKQYLVMAEERHANLLSELASIEKLQDDFAAQLARVEAVFKPASSRLQVQKVTDRRSLAGGRNAPKEGGND